jgi:Sec-independent protein translocase protein TatA
VSSPIYVIVVLVLGVLFFGRNLPGVVRQLGASLIEFRKGLNDWKEVHSCSSPGVKESSDIVKQESEERFEALGTKFEPPL